MSDVKLKVKRRPQLTEEQRLAKLEQYSEDIQDYLSHYGDLHRRVINPSLDPVDDLDVFLETGLGLPPKYYDALQEAIKQQNELAERFETGQLTQQETQQVVSKLANVSNSSMKDLKLKKQAEYVKLTAAATTQERNQNEASSVVSSESVIKLATLQPQQLAEFVLRNPDNPVVRNLGLADAADSVRSERQQLAEALETEESEWEEGWQTQGQCDHPYIVTAVLAGSKSILELGKLKQSQQHTQDQVLQGSTAASTGFVPHKKYTEKYLRQQKAERLLSRQKLQLKLAFGASLGIVIMWRFTSFMRKLRRSSGKPPQTGPKKTRKAQAT